MPICVQVCDAAGNAFREFEVERNSDYDRPYDVSVTAQFIFVAAAKRIYRYTHDGKAVESFGEAGKGTGQLVGAVGLSADEKRDALYVVDNQRSRVLVYALSSGKFLREFGSNGSGDGQWHRSNGIAVSADLIYVTDYQN